jgi:hypothetical protein
MPEQPNKSRSKFNRKKCCATPEEKLERLLLSQGYPRSQWDAQLKLLPDDDRKRLAGLVDDFGIVKKGTREEFEATKRRHLTRIREAPAKPAKETGGDASG